MKYYLSYYTIDNATISKKAETFSEPNDLDAILWACDFINDLANTTGIPTVTGTFTLEDNERIIAEFRDGRFVRSEDKERY